MEIADALNVEMDALQNRLKDSIKAETKRGRDIYSLESDVQRLEGRAQQFRVQSRETKKKLFLKNMKWIIIAGILVLLLVVFVYRIFA